LKTVIIIVGAARSGSTLLAKAIGGHSSCFTLGEINRFNQEISNPETLCGCGEKLNECNFWINILKKLGLVFKPSSKSDSKFKIGIYNQVTKKNKLHKLFATILFNKVYKDKNVDKEIKNTFTIYNKIFDKTQASVLIDSTKGLFRALILESNTPKDINFQFVQLTRDGRGVLNSGLKSSYSILHKDGIFKKYKGIENKDPVKIVNSWLYVNLRNYIILKLLRKKKTTIVKYEEFTDKPEYFLKLIFRKVNLDYEKSVLDLGENENHILGGNASRINAKKIKKQDDAWRRNLDKTLLKMFNRKAGWFNKLIGYK